MDKPEDRLQKAAVRQMAACMARLAKGLWAECVQLWKTHTTDALIERERDRRMDYIDLMADSNDELATQRKHNDRHVKVCGTHRWYSTVEEKNESFLF